MVSEARSPQAYKTSSRARSRLIGVGPSPRRCREQLLDLGIVEDLGQFLRPPRRAEDRRRVVRDQLVAAQVLVEGAQAGGLAVDGRRRTGGAPVAGRQVGEEVGDVGGARP